MRQKKFTPLALFIASALLPFSTQAQINMEQAAEQTFQIITQLRDRAIAGDGVIEENNKRYIVLNNHRFELHNNNYPKFPVTFGDPDALKLYYDTFSFLDDKWDIVMNTDNGFYFIHDEFGSMSSSTQGCFIEYYPNESFSTNKIMRFEKTECIDAPNISEIALSSIYDQGATVTWKDHVKGNQYRINLTKVDDAGSAQIFKVAEPEFFLPQLAPNTQYQIQIQACNTTGCVDLKAFSFSTEDETPGFHDRIRTLNHLEGELSAHLSLMQSHSLTAPFGNAELGAPDAVIGRNAMLLVNPQLNDINQMWVEIYQDGELITREAMLPPSDLPRTDQYAVEDRPTIIFAHNTWSFPLQWDWMKPGLSLTLVDNHGRTGELAQQQIEFGGAPELVIQNIDLGMLIEPRGRNNMANNTAEHAADYFQKIPVSKLVLGQYVAAYFDKVTLPNGKIYIDKSDSAGGWHAGDMRETIGKALISIGINNANVGIVASAGSSQAYNRRFNHITAHTNIGVYTDPQTQLATPIVHGGSGGGGIVTLEDTIGNEWSHELAHNFGLGHYPNMASVHDMQSGWGWDNLFQRFIGNVDWRGPSRELSLGGETSLPYLDTFRFLADSQAGGELIKLGLVSNYTYQHPMQVRRIQTWLNSGYNQDPSSKGYYVSWDQSLQRYVNVESDYPSPEQTGVSVTSVVGIYDPLRFNPSQIYPVLYGNYGNTFQLPEATEFTSLDGDLTLSSGWHKVDNLTEQELALSSWKTLPDNGTNKRLCQFSYQTTKGDKVNLLGSVDEQTNVCSASDDMKWHIDGQRQQMDSVVGEYSLLYPFGRGKITYTPTPEIGEVSLCLLTNIDNPEHNGAGFVQNNNCSQIAGIKHNNDSDWTYTLTNSFISTPSYTHNNVCRIDVQTQDGQLASYDLPAQRLNSNESNKFHLNLPQQELSSVTIRCQDNEGEHVLDQLTPALETGLDDLPAPVILGQEHGYDALISGIANGWFDHTEKMDYNNLSPRDRKNLVTMNMAGSKLPVCRFDLDIDGITQTVHGFVEQLVTNDYRCTGGNEITVRQNGVDNRLESALNQFQWLSSWNPLQTGERIKAKSSSDQNLCSLINNEFYGVGFIKNSSQCVQVDGIKWSNGLDWIFSQTFGEYTFK